MSEREDDRISDEARSRRDAYREDDHHPRRRPQRDTDDEPKKSNTGMIVLWILLGVGAFSLLVCGGLALLLLPAVTRVRQSAAKLNSANNLKQIGIAVHGHHSTFMEIPRDIRSPDGKPLLSWRVRILPFIEQDNLYRQFKLDEPWDGPNNKRLLSMMPKTYLLNARQSPEDVAQGLTYYQGFSGPDTVLDPKPRALSFGSIQDGLGNTIFAIEAATPLPWSKPEDIDFDPNRPVSLQGHHGSTINVLFLDGSVRPVNVNQANFEQKLRAAVGYKEGLVLPLE